MKKMKIEKTEKPRFRTNYNNYKSVTDKEKVDPVSMTVPNETYSLRQIVEKFSREYPKNMLRTGYFDTNDEYDFDDIDPTRSGDFDLVDALELKGKIQEKRSRKQTIQETLKTDAQPTETQPSEV